jgi:hypothetical protein
MDSDSPRARAARAKRSLRMNEPSEGSTPDQSTTRRSVKVSDLSFTLDEEAVRSVEQERSKVRNILGLKE